MVADAFDQRVGLARQATGIEGQDCDRQRVACDQIGQHHILGTEAAGQRGRSMARGDPLQQPHSIRDTAFGDRGHGSSRR